MLVVFGAGGQVGGALRREAARRGLAHRALARADADIARPDAVLGALDGASLVVNCAAYTAVDRAESEQAAAFAANRDGPAVLAAACAKQGIPLIHLSTDYVFPGMPGRPWREDDPTGPLNVYGASKLAGEVAVRDALERSIILRTGWVFAADGQNFVRTMLRLAAERPELRIVDDQRGGPTHAGDIATAILEIAAQALAPGFRGWGIYHYGGAPPTDWHGFARAILAGRDRPVLRPIPSAEFPTPARRPENSVLDCSRIGAVFGLAQPDWRPALAGVLAALA